MLTKIREKFTGGLAIAILLLIGIPFMFVGINSSVVGSSSYAAKVDGSEISSNDFEASYRQQLDQDPRYAQLPDEFRLQLRQNILDSLIRDRLVELYLIDSGYRISNSQVNANIHRIPAFQIDGVFDRETFDSVLLQNGLAEERFFESQRRAMREDQLRRAIGATALVTPAEYRRYLNLVAEQRLVSFATFDLDSAKQEVDVSDDMVAAYYDDNDDLFLTPETADIEFIEVRRDVVAATIDISEQALQDYYLDSQNRYLQDEQRRARHILILFNDDEDAAELTANELLARARAGESFEELATEYSHDGGTASAGGDLGTLTLTQLPGELGSSIFAMSEGDLDGPIKSNFGFHIVRLDEILEQGPLPLEQVRGELLSELREGDTEDAFRELERKLSDALFDLGDMQEISAATGLEVQTAMAFSRGGGEPFGSNQAAIDAVFDERVITDGEVSEIVELDANRSAVFKVTQHNAAARRPLEDVRDQVADSLRTQQAMNAITERSEQLMAALAAGELFAPAAEAAGAALSAPQLIGRQDADVDQAVTFQVFMATKPVQNAPVTGKVSTADGGYTVFNLEAVLRGRPQTIPQDERDAGKLQLAQQSGAGDYVAFVQSLFDAAEIIINQDILAASDLLQ